VITTVTDAAGNSTADSSIDEVIVDLVPPPAPTVASQITNNTTPTITGTAVVTATDTLTVNVDGVLYSVGDGNLVDNGDGTWALTIPAANALIDAAYDVTATVTDAAGNPAPDATAGELIIDLTPPPAPGVTSQTTQDTTPVISGLTVLGAGLTLSVDVNGVVYTAGDGNLVDNLDGTWDLTIPAIDVLPDGLYQVIATLTDAAGNTANDPGIDDLVVDTLAPPSPGVTSLVTNNNTPVIEGTATVAAGETLTVTVNAVVYTAGDGNLVDNGDGTWMLTIPTANQLLENNYNVTASVEDIAGNFSTDPSSAELTVDLTAPAPPFVASQLTNNPTPTIVGMATVANGYTLTVAVNGVTYTAGDGNLVDNGDSTWQLVIPAADALLDNTYDVSVTVSDPAGNTSVDASIDELVVDLVAPVVPTVTALLTNNPIPQLSGTATIVAGETFTVEVNNVVYSSGDGNLVDNGDGTWDLTIPAGNALADANYEVIATVTDPAGNAAVDTSNYELVVDLTAPLPPGVTSQSTQDTTPVISGTRINGSGLTLSVVVNGVSYTAGDGNLVDNGDYQFVHQQSNANGAGHGNCCCW